MPHRPNMRPGDVTDILGLRTYTCRQLGCRPGARGRYLGMWKQLRDQLELDIEPDQLVRAVAVAKGNRMLRFTEAWQFLSWAQWAISRGKLPEFQHTDTRFDDPIERVVEFALAHEHRIKWRKRLLSTTGPELTHLLSAWSADTGHTINLPGGTTP